ncbi:ATP-dependent DNA helicase RecQ [Candidatus Micrarchaeota archaeon]|nr:ATP-dependent DNA helicase RecQ [Candidatus Micrarchaeota archaeon]
MSSTTSRGEIQKGAVAGEVIRPAFRRAITPPDPLIVEGIRSRATTALQNVFKLSEFLPGQFDTILNIMLGSDTFTVLSTGYGKTLCFQIPAHLLQPDLTVVVSPLIALMNDQVERARALGLSVSCVHSEMPKEVFNDAYRRTRLGQNYLLYVSPEQLGSTQFFEGIGTRKVGLLAVDEAHCTSTWGHDFRPSYLFIREARRRLGNPPLALFTATAPPHTRNDMRVLLGVADCFENIGHSVRENISFSVEKFISETSKRGRLLELLREDGGPTIVYCSTVSMVDELSEFLNQFEIKHLKYHGQMAPFEKEATRRAFEKDQIQIIVCTKAFGMGIDKGNVKRIIHHQMPGSLEEYYQEVGRAGRNGEEARGILLFCEEDVKPLIYFIETKNPPAGFVYQIYDRLHALYVGKVGMQKRKGKFEGVTNAQLLRYIRDRYEKDNRLLQMATASYGLLVEYGYIVREGEHVHFPQMEGRERISDSSIEEKRSRDYKKLDVMLYYARRTENHAEFVRTYMDESTEEILKQYPSIETFIKTALFTALAIQRTSKRQHAIVLTGRGREKEIAALSEHPLFGMLSFMSQPDIEFKLEQMERRGLVKMVRQGRSSVVILTALGIEKAGEMRVPVPEEHSDSEDVLTDEAQGIIGKAITPALELVARRNKNVDDWSSTMPFFLRSEFSINGIKISGRVLIAKFLGMQESPKEGRKIRYSDFKAFVEFYTELKLP